MLELFNAAFSSVNLFPTILLLVILAYWLFVIIGALDMDFLNVEVDAGDIEIDADVDIDMDADADLDTEVDTEIDADTETEINTDTDTHGAFISMNAILGFFNLGKVPFMLLLSFFILPLWIFSILSNYLFHNESLIFSLVLLIPNIIVSLSISKVLTTPFAIIYTKMAKNSDEAFKYAGKMCTIVMSADNKQIGQAEIRHNGNTYRINILTKDENRIKKGESALVINYIKNKKCYLVEPYKI